MARSLPLAIALLGIAAVVLPAPALGFFGKAKSFPTELRAYSMTVGDLNGDRKPDLAVAGIGVSVLLGNGRGDFGKPRLVGPGSPSSAVAIGDLNGDGNPDLAVTHPGAVPVQGGGGVSVLLGNGKGDFGKPQLFAAGTPARGIAIGDLNGDGKLDLVFTRGSAFGKPEAVSVLLGNGDGTFGPAGEYRAGFEPGSLVIGDLNDDGIPDLAVDSPEPSGGGLAILLGNGDGSFGPAKSYGVGGAVAIGDLNGDGKPDLAVTDSSSNAVSVLFGNGDGSFGPPQNFAAGEGPDAVVIGKLNGDAFPDLALASQRTGNVSVLLGNGAGSFGRPKNFTVGTEPGPIAIADFNGDSRPDLVVANGAQRSVSVLLNGRSSAALSLSYKSRRHRFSGGLRSIDPVCANHRWIVVLRRRKGLDQEVGGAMTSRKGTYSIRRQVGGGTYYAHARSSSACRAESSKAITLR
ncbi:MAG: FG-GAP repeat domain-containing protein [Solirubrobacterales bacterium]